MKLSIIAAVTYSIYYNGRPQTGAERLDQKDFRVLVDAASGAILRDMYYQEREAGGNVSEFFSTMVELREVVIDRSGREAFIDENIFNLPGSLGIFNIYPLPDDPKEAIDYESAFTFMPTGSSWFFTPAKLEDMGVDAYTLRGGKPVLYCDERIKGVAVEGIFKSDNIDLPDTVAWAVINLVLGPTLKVAGFPVNMKNNGDPNVELIRSKIAEAQPL